MATATKQRRKPLTDAQRRERNRLYQMKRRLKTDNAYARAYRKASQRAVAWMQENEPMVWWQLMKEAQGERGTGPYAPGRWNPRKDDGTKPRNPRGGTELGRTQRSDDCDHHGGHYIMGLTIGCSLCGRTLGAESLTLEERELILEVIDGRLGDLRAGAE